MNNISGKSVFEIAKFDLKTSRKGLIGWFVAIFAVMFLYMILFPSIQEIGMVEFEVMPKELLQFMGMEDFTEMSNFVSYFGMIFSLVLIAISVFAGNFAAGLLYKEEKDKTIEFLYSLEVSRIEIYVAKALTSILGTLVISFAAVSSTILCGIINGGDTFDAGAIVRIAKFSGFIPFLFTAIALFLAGTTAKFKVSMASSMLVFFSYLLGYLSTLLGDKATWLAYFSPFEVLNAKLVSDAGGKELISILVCLVIFLIFVIVGGIAYNKRDFHV